MKIILLAIALLLNARDLFAADPAVEQCTTLKLESSPTNTTNRSFSILPTTGNKLKIYAAYYIVGSFGGSGDIAGSDNQSGNSYAVDKDQKAATGLDGNHWRATILSGYVVGSSGTFTLTLTAPNSDSAYWAWMACEVSGLVSMSSLDKTGSTENAGSTTSITANGSGANAQNCEFVSAMVYDGNGGNQASGYTELLSDTTLLGIEAGYKVINTAQTSSASWTFSAFTGALAIVTTDKGDDCNSAVQRRTPADPRTGTRTLQ